MLSALFGLFNLKTPAFLLQPLGVSLLIGVLIFVVVYIWFDSITNFFFNKLSIVQKDILTVMDKLLIVQKKETIIRNCWIFSGALSLLVLFLIWPNVLLSFGLAVVTFLGTWFAIRMFLNNMWEVHCDKAVYQMVDGLTMMCNSLKVGLSLPQALERVVKASPGPLAKEFRLVLNKNRLGQSLEESLEEMGERVNRPDIDMLVSTVNILKESGGNLAETFFVMSETLRERQKMDKKIKALTAQGLMQAKIISCLPFILIGIFFFMDRAYISPLLFKPLGWLCLLVVLVLVLIGWYAMKKIVAIKV